MKKKNVQKNFAKNKPQGPMSKELNERYEVIANLGSGAYGSVAKVKDKKKGQTVALKVCYFHDHMQNEGLPSSTVREIALLKKIHHPNIIELKEVHYSALERILMLSFECMDYDLSKFQSNANVFKGTIQEIREIIHSILKGVDYLHSCGVLHRDLKPQNIFLNSTKIVKIGDFGLSRSFTFPFAHYSLEIETRYYRAPELFLGESAYSSAVDMWSIGCIFAELCEKNVFLKGESDIDQLFKIFDMFGTPNEKTYPGCTKFPFWNNKHPQCRPKDLGSIVKNISKNGLDLLGKMVAFCPTDRISVRDALQHPFFTEEK